MQRMEQIKLDIQAMEAKLVPQKKVRRYVRENFFNFSGIEPTPKYHRETDLERDTVGTAKESNSKISNM